MIPERNSASKFAKSVFFEDQNDIDIYIEDTASGYEKIFVEILSRALQGQYVVSKVFPLGERNNVVKRCRSMQDELGRPSLFIIDGDLFLLTGDPVTPLSGLYILPFYCIENILIDPEAIHLLMNEEETIKSMQEIVGDFSYELWKKDNVDPLVSLFIEYALTFKLNSTVKTVAFSVSNLVSSNKGYLDLTKISQRIADLKISTIAAIGEEMYAEQRKEIEAVLEAEDGCKLKYISGKDYLLPLLKTRIKSMVKTKISDANLKLRLAMKCNISQLAGIDRNILGFERT